MSKEAPSATYQVWTSEPLFTRKQVEAITERASLLTKFKLLFRRSRYTFDDGAMFRYKEMNGKIYVMKRGTRLYRSGRDMELYEDKEEE